MTHSAKDFRNAALMMLPKGPIWNRSPDSVMGLFWLAVGQILSEMEIGIQKLSKETCVRTTNELLSEWECDYNLPTPFNNNTFEARRAAVLAKQKKKEIPTEKFVKDFAAALGYDLIIVHYHKPFQCGVAEHQCGDGIHECGCPPSITGISVVHSRGIIPPEYFEMEMRRILPAHIDFHFNYKDVK